MTEGSLTIGVSYHGFPIYTQSMDLCQQTQCPVERGPVSVSLEEPFPVITPPVCLSLICFYIQTLSSCLLAVHS